MRRLIIQPASHFVALCYIMLYSRYIQYRSRCVALHCIRICMALALTYYFKTAKRKKRKNRNANIHLASLAFAFALRCITRASHPHHVFRYVGITSAFRFAPSFGLALDYVGVALRVGGGRIHVALTLIRVLINRQFNAVASGVNFLRGRS